MPLRRTTNVTARSESDSTLERTTRQQRVDVDKVWFAQKDSGRARSRIARPYDRGATGAPKPGRTRASEGDRHEDLRPAAVPHARPGVRRRAPGPVPGA